MLPVKGYGLRIVGAESVPGVDKRICVAEETEDTTGLALVGGMQEIALRDLAVFLDKRFVHIKLLHTVFPGRIERLLAHQSVTLHRVADGEGGIGEDAVVAAEHLGIHASHRGAEDERRLLAAARVEQKLESLPGMQGKVGSHHTGLGKHLTETAHRAAAAAGTETVNVEHRLAAHQFGKLLDIGIVRHVLIPAEVVGIAALLLPLEGVGKHAAVGLEGEIVGGVGIEHHRTAHIEAMEVARQRGGGHGEARAVEVVAGGERDVPTRGDADVAREVERVAQSVGIAHRLLVERAGSVLTHRKAVADGKAPGDVELEVAVLVDLILPFLLLGTVLGTLALGVHIGIVGIGSEVVIVVALLVGILVFLAREEVDELLQGLVVEGVTEVLTHALETSEASPAPLRMLAHVGVAVLIEVVGISGKYCSH